jgi:hypothetical protein
MRNTWTNLQQEETYCMMALSFKGSVLTNIFQYINNQVVACVEKLKYIITCGTYESCEWMKTGAIGDTEMPNFKIVM